MSFYTKTSSYIKRKNRRLWLVIKSVISMVRHAFQPVGFPASFHPDERAVFLQIPKTATSTTMSLFLKKQGIPFDVHNYHSIHAIGQELFSTRTKANLKNILNTQDIFSFTFSRNPYTRLISCYRDKIEKEKDFAILDDYFGVFHEGMSFEEFAEKVCLIPNFWANIHFKPQHTFVFFPGTPPPHFIGKIENYKADLAVIQEKLSLPEVTQDFNVTAKGYDLSEWYTKDLAKKVYRRYKKDFILFGYTPDFDMFK